MSGLTEREFEEIWHRLDADAQAAKFSQDAVLRLMNYYRTLDEVDRRTVDAVLGSWVLDGDERQRFDALALMDEFEIHSAVPALEADLARRGATIGPSVPTDRAKLERIIGRLR